MAKASLLYGFGSITSSIGKEASDIRSAFRVKQNQAYILFEIATLSDLLWRRRSQPKWRSSIRFTARQVLDQHHDFLEATARRRQ